MNVAIELDDRSGESEQQRQRCFCDGVMIGARCDRCDDAVPARIIEYDRIAAYARTRNDSQLRSGGEHTCVIRLRPRDHCRHAVECSDDFFFAEQCFLFRWITDLKPRVTQPVDMFTCRLEEWGRND